MGIPPTQWRTSDHDPSFNKSCYLSCRKTAVTIRQAKGRSIDGCVAQKSEVSGVEARGQSDEIVRNPTKNVYVTCVLLGDEVISFWRNSMHIPTAM